MLDKICRILFLLFSLPLILTAREIETFYGPMDVQEPVLLELIDSPVFQRLKNIHQYGVGYYTTYREEYNRYDHSIGVFIILRAHGASLEEQIAGLLHDVSHTAFSHVSDWIFDELDYQDNVHSRFIEKSGLGDILKKHHYTIGQILPLEELFPALEKPLPDLCADRIDYNIQGAYYQGFITREEAQAIFKEIQFKENNWVSTRPDLMKKLTLFSLVMTQDCWGGPRNHMTSRWLADAIVRGIELGVISYDNVHFGTDQVIWDKLSAHLDPIIVKKMKMVLNADEHFRLVEPGEADLIVKSKFRGIDPLVVADSKCLRLTGVDQQLAEEFEKVRQILEKGWAVKINDH